MSQHPAKMKGGDEYDAFTRWRRWIRWRAGELRKVKRRYWKRVRRMWRDEGRAVALEQAHEQ